MAATINDYVYAALVSLVADKQAELDRTFISKDDQAQQLDKIVPVEVDRSSINFSIDNFIKMGAISIISDDVAGDFYRLDPAKIIEQMGAMVRDQSSLAYKYRVIGPNFLRAAVARLSSENGDTPDVAGIEGLAVPASDRIVTLHHNQSVELEKPVEEMIAKLEDDNGLPDSPGLRERVLGQIRAGRELLRSGSFRAYLLYETLVRGLLELAEHYKDHVIGAAAGKLVELLIEQIFKAL